VNEERGMRKEKRLKIKDESWKSTNQKSKINKSTNQK
jgi:hypothetical protein